MNKIQRFFLLAFIFANTQYYLKSMTITVINESDSGPGTLREAISNVQPNGTIDFNLLNSNVILLESPLQIHSSKNNIIINGDNNGNSVFIDGSSIPSGGGAILSIGAGGVSIENLTIQNGQGGNVTTDSPGGIFIQNSASCQVSISNCTIKGCYANGVTQGGNGGVGAIYVEGGNEHKLENLIITDCHADGGINGNGGKAGIALGNSVNCLTINNCQITGCTANCSGSGIGGTGGIYIVNSNDSTISGVTISECEANGGVGGVGGISIVASINRTKIINCNILGCQANGGNNDSGNGYQGGVGAVSINSNFVNFTDYMGSIENMHIENCQANGGNGASGSSGGIGGVGAIGLLNVITFININECNITGCQANGGFADGVQANGGTAAILIDNESSSNFVQSCNINSNNAGPNGNVVVVSNKSLYNSILSNNIFNNNLNFDEDTFPITLLPPNNPNSGNHYQLAPTISSALLCPCGPDGGWQLTVEGKTPINASGGQNRLLIQVFFSKPCDYPENVECNKYIGSFKWAPDTEFTSPPFVIDDPSDVVTYCYIVLTATNSNGNNKFADDDDWGDTSMISNPQCIFVS